MTKRYRTGWLAHWQLVWERDDPYHPGDAVFFDHHTTSIVWIGEESQKDDEVREALAEVMSDPDRYKEIPRLHHWDHHKIFRDWRENHVPEEVRVLCNDASIGGFFKDLEYHLDTSRAHEIRWGWYEFREQALKQRTASWLAKRGWEVEWV